MRRWHSEPPQYLLDLYNQVVDANGLTRLPLPYGATKVRTFSEKGWRLLHFFFIVPVLIRLIARATIMRTWRAVCVSTFFLQTDEGKKSTFSYSISGLREEEEIVEVEFHVYHSGLPREQRHLLEHDMYMVSGHAHCQHNPSEYKCNITLHRHTPNVRVSR